MEITKSGYDYLKAMKFSKRQTEVIVNVLKHDSNRDIGKAMFVHEKTVKWHLTRIYKRLNINSRYGLMRVMAPHTRAIPIE